MHKNLTKILLGTLALSAIALTGCAKKPGMGTSPDDPFESYNRAMFKVNAGIDFVVFRPLAQVYDALVPNVMQLGVTNFFQNIDEISTFPNDFLQGNFKYMAVDFWRFVINSTFGVGGIFDVATRWGIQPHVESFGLTLAKWRGGKSAPYFTIPVFGPSTFQSAIGLGVDYFTTPWPYLNNQTVNYVGTGIRMVSIRARLLPADKVIGSAFDPYVFVRDAYLQKEKEKIAENETLGQKKE